MGKVISLADRRVQKEEKEQNQQLLGYLIWLHCPTCKTTEYTMVLMEGGRIHKCGTMVEEKEVPIDIRAEYTLCQRNLEIIDKWHKKTNAPKILDKLFNPIRSALNQVESNEREYMKRLQTLVRENIEPYPEEWDPQKDGIEVQTIPPLGIQISSARQSDLYFPSNSKK